MLTVTDPADIEQLSDIHRLMIRENKQVSPHSGRYFTLLYKLKNGSTVSRTYRIHNYGDAMEALQPYLTKPAYLFGIQSLEQLQQFTVNIYSSELQQIPDSLWPELLKAMWLDAQTGHLSITGDSFSSKPMMYMELRIQNRYRAVYFTEDAPHLQQWLKQYRTSPQLLLKHDSLEKLIANTYAIHDYSKDRELPEGVYSKFLTMLWQDCQNGKVGYGGKWDEGSYIELQTGDFYISLSLAHDSQCAHWLKEYPGK